MDGARSADAAPDDAAPDDAAPDDAAPDGRDETEEERADRNYGELLQELRVAQTGVQILFAFLLTLPFTQRFGVVTAEQRVVYLITTLATALSTACLIAPVSHHRILFGQRRKVELVRSGSGLAQCGLLLLWLAVVGALFLIFDVVLGGTAATAVAVGMAGTFVLIWYVYPAVRRLSAREHADVGR
jgi:hypothetical protein